VIYGFTPGLLGLLQMPAHLIVLVGGGLLLGQQGMPHRRWLIPGFVLSLLAGMWVANIWQPVLPLDNELALLGMAMGIGLLVIVALPLPRWLVVGLLLVAACLLGLDTVPVMLPGISPRKLYWTLAGSAAGSFLLLLAVTLLGLLLRKLWEGIGLRVLGSWVTASALLTLTLRLAQKS
jgi:urease accessory protein